jgi:ubiquinone biosynthesis protein UbiJ
MATETNMVIPRDEWEALQDEASQLRGALERLSEKLNDPEALKRIRERLLAERAHGNG